MVEGFWALTCCRQALPRLRLCVQGPPCAETPCCLAAASSGVGDVRAVNDHSIFELCLTLILQAAVSCSRLWTDHNSEQACL